MPHGAADQLAITHHINHLRFSEPRGGSTFEWQRGCAGATEHKPAGDDDDSI
jgi:hypothetical protein